MSKSSESELLKLKQHYSNSLDNIRLHLARYGCKIEDIKDSWSETGEIQVIDFFISVPESSYMNLEDEQEASKETLAKWAKEYIRREYDILTFEGLKALTDVSDSEIFRYMSTDLYKDTTISNKIKVKYKVRPERWTRELEEQYTQREMIVLGLSKKLRKMF